MDYPEIKDSEEDYYHVPKPKTGMDRRLNIIGILLGIVMLIMVINALLNQ